MSTTAANETGPIVVGIDGSDASLAALSWAAAQARRTKCPVRAVITWIFPANYGAFGLAAAIPEGLDFSAEATTVLHESVTETLGESPDIVVEETVVEGHPALVLVEESKLASLVVVGSRGHGGFAGLLLGSVSEHLAAHAHCPVVVVHHH